MMAVTGPIRGYGLKQEVVYDNRTHEPVETRSVLCTSSFCLQMHTGRHVRYVRVTSTQRQARTGKILRAFDRRRESSSLTRGDDETIIRRCGSARRTDAEILARHASFTSSPSRFPLSLSAFRPRDFECARTFRYRH